MRAGPKPLVYDIVPPASAHTGIDAPADIAIVGAGAAGLAAAFWAARTAPAARVTLLDGARTLGAKILVSGGGRCNVTNREVTERDFHGGSPRLVKRVLQAFPVAATRAWFGEMGVPLHEEALGKLFPATNRARTVLDALVTACRDAGVRIQPSSRVSAVDALDGATALGARFALVTPGGLLHARRLVLATGGLALPRSGSDGAGYAMAAAFGHRLVPTTPALVPLVLGGHVHGALAGVSLPCRLRLETSRPPGARPTIVDGAFLWTHTGASGPAVLDVSRHWLRADLEGRDPALQASWLTGEPPGRVEEWLVAAAREHPRAALRTVLSHRLPASMADLVANGPAAAPMAVLRRDERRSILSRLTAWPLEVTGSRGYTHAEVTAGGIALDEIDTATMASRLEPALYLVGELLDVDGRLGGFNFQWAWSSGAVAGRAAARSLGR